MLLSWFGIAMVGNRLQMSSYEREHFEFRCLIVACIPAVTIGSVAVALVEWRRRKKMLNADLTVYEAS